MAPFSSCDEDRLRLAQKAEEQFTQARKLAQEQDYPGALESYLFAFDNGWAVSSWGGVRLSYIPSEIAKLGDVYPPAKTALEERRNAREELIRKGETDFEIVHEWISLNRYLHESERELRLLKELQENGTLEDSLKKRVISENFERILDEKRYDLLSEYFDDFGRKFLFEIFHYEHAVLFPEQRPFRSMSEFRKNNIRTDGAKVFELALGTEKELQAGEIAKRMLLHCNDSESYKLLLNAAKRAGRKNKVQELLQQAKDTLSKDEYKQLENA